MPTLISFGEHSDYIILESQRRYLCLVPSLPFHPHFHLPPFQISPYSAATPPSCTPSPPSTTLQQNLKERQIQMFLEAASDPLVSGVPLLRLGYILRRRSSQGVADQFESRRPANSETPLSLTHPKSQAILASLSSLPLAIFQSVPLWKLSLLIVVELAKAIQ